MTASRVRTFVAWLELPVLLIGMALLLAWYALADWAKGVISDER